MQVLPQANVTISLHQKQLNEFQDECLDMLDTDEHTLSALRDLVDDHGAIDGVITVTHPTKTYMKHLRAQGLKLKNNKPIINYIPFKDLVEATRNMMNAQLSSILSHYQQLSLEQKKTTFLFRFQLPYSYNPSQSLQNYHFVENLDLTAKVSSTVSKEDPQEECKDSATRKEEFKRNRRMDRKKLNSFFH